MPPARKPAQHGLAPLAVEGTDWTPVQNSGRGEREDSSAADVTGGGGREGEVRMTTHQLSALMYQLNQHGKGPG